MIGTTGATAMAKPSGTATGMRPRPNTKLNIIFKFKIKKGSPTAPLFLF
jgi:hypothetical protein